MMDLPTFDIERSTGYLHVVGIDEAGCGPWAGPVVVAAVVFPHNRWGDIGQTLSLNDSKKLTPKKREILFNHICSLADFGIAQASVEEIDLYNIVGALRLATHRAVTHLPNTPEIALIDGIRNPQIDIPTQMVIGGDKKSCSIAAASILAKVTRDRLMIKLAEHYPYYGWEKNAGYGTKHHQEGLASHGVTEHHRKTYAPIKRILEIEERHTIG